jgi:hypothetical protein
MIQNRSQTPHVLRLLAESSPLYMYRISVSDAGVRTARSRVRPVAAKWRHGGCTAAPAHTGHVRAAGLPPTHAQHAACFAVYSEMHYIYKYIKYIYIYTNGSPWSAGTLHHYVRDPAPNQLLQAADNSSPAGRHSSTPRSGISVVLHMIANCDKRPI